MDKDAIVASMRTCTPNTVIKLVWVAVIVFLLTAAWGIFSYAQEKTRKAATTISFTGTSEVVVINDIALLSFTYSEKTEEGDELNDALDTVSEQVNGTYDELKGFGVEARDIKTTQYSVTQEYIYINPTRLTPGRQELDGFKITHASSVRIRDIEDVGKILNAITERNPTHVGNLSFTIDDEVRRELEEEALILATRNAKAQAKRVAKQTKLNLQGIVNIQTNDVRPYYQARSFSTLESVSSLNSSIKTLPVSQGEDIITKRVTITYEVK